MITEPPTASRFPSSSVTPRHADFDEPLARLAHRRPPDDLLRQLFGLVGLAGPGRAEDDQLLLELKRVDRVGTIPGATGSPSPPERRLVEIDLSSWLIKERL